MNKNYQPYSDAELYLALSGSDVAHRDMAFREIYNRYSARIYLYCKKILGNDEQTEDVFQDTFTSLIRTADKDRQMDNLPAYILRIARNNCLQVRRTLLRDEGTLPFNELIYTPKQELQQVEINELGHLLTVALDLLSEEQREAIILQVYDGLSYEEISGVLDVPVSTVRNWIVRGKKKLRDSLEPHWADYRE